MLAQNLTSTGLSGTVTISVVSEHPACWIYLCERCTETWKKIFKFCIWYIGACLQWWCWGIWVSARSHSALIEKVFLCLCISNQILYCKYFWTPKNGKSMFSLQIEPNLAQRGLDSTTAIPGFSNWDLATIQKFGKKKIFWMPSTQGCFGMC